MMTIAIRSARYVALLLASMLSGTTAAHAGQLPECSDPALRQVVSDVVGEAYAVYTGSDQMGGIAQMLKEILGPKGNAIRKAAAADQKVSVNDIRVCGYQRENDDSHVSFLTVIYNKSGLFGGGKWEGEIYNVGLPVPSLEINSGMARK